MKILELIRNSQTWSEEELRRSGETIGWLYTGECIELEFANNNARLQGTATYSGETINIPTQLVEVVFKAAIFRAVLNCPFAHELFT